MKKKHYMLGDVIRLSNCGSCYTTYTNAIRFFNIFKNIKNSSLSHYETIVPEDYNKTNWVIVGIAKHSFFKNTLIYCIENHRFERLITSDEYFRHRPNVINNYTKYLKEKNKTYDIETIP